MQNIDLELLPDPKRVIEGLRDTGYNFNTAIADIVDNSIAANASSVDLQIKMDYRGEVRVSIADNGDGMNRDGLINAMRYGAKARPNPASLGKYGLGLKTASTAFARRLSVVSRPSGSEAPLMATWDLDHVGTGGRGWSLILGAPDDESLEHLNKVANDRAGTVVVWTKVDRLMKTYQSPGGAPARNALTAKIDELRIHLSMVYQRFLNSKDKRARKHVTISVEGQPLKAWDPFAEGLSEVVGNTTIPVDLGNGSEASFTVRAFILPRNEEFPTPELAKEARVSANKQGIYIYRENRLIVESSWLGMYQQEPHGSLLRVEFSFDHKLDDHFHLDIKKSQIGLNDDIYKYLLEQFLPAPRREANRRYRLGEQKKVADSAGGAHKNSNTNIKNREAAAGGAEVSIVNPATGDVEVRNANGVFRLKLPITSANTPGEVFVQPVSSINNGLLFEPVMIEQKRGVRINQSHPYYHKVYVPNLKSSVTVQGMDSLLWALAVAELTAIRDSTSEHFQDLRYEMSRILSRLVESLPEPELTPNAE
ncbi:ATP-binding protein [Povalibacter sp.]|uniref:ATP-binding protein n=1 Tax=Povalibacter sp. TaxID=1962978 RepID=UPI002F4016D2